MMKDQVDNIPILADLQQPSMSMLDLALNEATITNYGQKTRLDRLCHSQYTIISITGNATWRAMEKRPEFKVVGFIVK